MNDIIAFYTTKDEWGCFSNFYRARFVWQGRAWKTSEHFYQAQKAIHSEDYVKIWKAETPKEAAKIGRSIECRPEWDSIKYEVMMEGCRAKYNQNPHLKQRLLNTGVKEIVEWTEGTPLADSIWGNAKDKDGNPGQNLLGKVLMELREEFRKQPQTAIEGI